MLYRYRKSVAVPLREASDRRELITVINNSHKKIKLCFVNSRFSYQMIIDLS